MSRYVATWSGEMPAVLPMRPRWYQVQLRRDAIAHRAGLVLVAHGLHERWQDRLRERLAQQRLHRRLGLAVPALAVVVEAQVALAVDEVLGRPVAVRVGLPDRIVVVEHDRVRQPLLRDGAADVLRVVGEGELRRVHADDHQAEVAVAPVPLLHVGQRAQAVDARKVSQWDESELPLGSAIADGGVGTSQIEMPAPKCPPECSCGKHSAETRAKISAARKGYNPTAETRAKISAANKGKKLSAEHRAKQSAAMLGRKQTLERRTARAVTYANYQRARPMTRLEQFVHDHVLADFPEVQREIAFGPYVVDFYVPSHHLAFEVDGNFHRLPEHVEGDQRRDGWLLAECNLPVVRLTEHEIKRLAA
jgi:very-short-patch-repair endonuclease